MPRLLLAIACAISLLVSTGSAYAQRVQDEGRTIGEIQVVGNQRIEAETIRSYLLVRRGDRMDPVALDRSLKELFATGLFADVTINVEGDRVIVQVVENPVINRVDFEGNDVLDDEDLRREIQLAPRSVYTRPRVQEDVERLLEVYRRSGRFAAKVEPKVIQLEQNRVDLVFEITEGPRTGVEKITFIGNKRFSDSTLRDVIRTEESRWYKFFTSDDTYDPDRLNFDRELLRKFYLAHGYADFRIKSAVAELTPEQDAFIITFVVEEGERYRFGSVSVESDLQEVSTAGLQDLVTTEAEDWYDADAVEESVQALTNALGDAGYAFVDVRPDVTRHRDERTIDLTYRIGEGPRIYVDRINITGNVRTLDKVIRREFELAEGDPFNAAKIRASRDNLRDLDFFKNVKVNTRPGAEPDKAEIDVNVDEKSTGELSFGVGYSTSSGPLGDIGIRERNLLGRGQDLQLSFTASGADTQIALSFTEPYFLDRDVAAGFDVFNTETDRDTESSYTQRATGMTLRANYWLLRKLRHGVRYTIRNDDISDIGTDASRYIRDQEGQRLSSIVGQTFTYDLRDSRLEPHSGWLVRFTQDIAGLGGDVRYLRNQLAYSYYYPLTDDLIANLAVQSGYVVGLGQDVRINDRFFLGGDNLRGFATAGAGPRDGATGDALGGNLISTGTLELAFPLGLPEDLRVRGRVFSDWGTLAKIDESGSDLLNEGSIRASIGAGMTWISPFGPIRIDFAQAVAKEDFDDTESFRFSFGTRF